jgi:hypothetical protein
MELKKQKNKRKIQIKIKRIENNQRNLKERPIEQLQFIRG